MSNNKNSAVSDDPIDVLVVLQDKFDLLDFAAVTETLTTALHDKNESCK
jgi:predicted nucleotidyltransferase